jgi:hypothetical protein
MQFYALIMVAGLSLRLKYHSISTAVRRCYHRDNTHHRSISNRFGASISGSIKCGEALGLAAKTGQLLKKDSAPCSK